MERLQEGTVVLAQHPDLGTVLGVVGRYGGIRFGDNVTWTTDKGTFGGARTAPAWAVPGPVRALGTTVHIVSSSGGYVSVLLDHAHAPAPFLVFGPIVPADGLWKSDAVDAALAAATPDMGHGIPMPSDFESLAMQLQRLLDDRAIRR